VEKMRTAFEVMKTNIKHGIDSTEPSIGGLIGKNAAAMHRYFENNRTKPNTEEFLQSL
jgi:L-serine deaminase